MTRRFTMHRARAATGAAEGEPEAPPQPAEAKPDGQGRTNRPKEIGGPSGPEPTRYGDWERKGVCYDF